LNPLIDKIADAVMYEGYILYPYRASSPKNQERFTFGRVYPRAYSLAQKGAEPFAMQTECLLRGNGEVPGVNIRLRFLHPMARTIGLLSSPAFELPSNVSLDCFSLVPELRTEDKLFQSWHEAVEREATFSHERIDSLAINPVSLPLHFADSLTFEPIRDRNNRVIGALIRQKQRLAGEMKISAQRIDYEVFKISVGVENHTPLGEAALDLRDELILRTFASTHMILESEKGEFLSLTDPPTGYARAAESCSNIGAWPVLVGERERGTANAVLSSPIILYDYPEIAAESTGEFFDGTEIDEMLALRVRTMTDEEKWEMSQIDERAREILRRSEALPEEAYWSMHGKIREMNFSDEDIFNPGSRINQISVKGVDLMVGDRVRIKPKERADLMDIALAGKIAVIESIELDAENRIHLALVLDEDPGKDFGMLRQPGHRFFYAVHEVEPISDR
jgi:hydrogenase maturation protease